MNSFFFVFEHFVKWQIWANHSHASRKKNILFFHHICDFFPFFSALSHYTLYSFNLIFCNICHNSFALYLFLFLILPSFFWQIVVSRKKIQKKKIENHFEDEYFWNIYSIISRVKWSCEIESKNHIHYLDWSGLFVRSFDFFFVYEIQTNVKNKTSKNTSERERERLNWERFLSIKSFFKLIKKNSFIYPQEVR